jgi:hypothetical protein
MRRAAAALVRSLPLDPRARRALNETLSDWRHELEMASAGGSRVVTDVRGLCAFVGALARVTAREASQPPAGRTVLSTVALAVPVGVLLVARDARRPDTWMAGLWDGATRTATIELLGALVVGALCLAVPVLLAGPPMKRGAEVPWLGTSAIALVGLLALNGWLWPSASQFHREHAYGPTSPFVRMVSQAPVPRGVSEMTLPEVAVRATQAGSVGETAKYVLSERLALVVAGPTFCLVGVLVRRFARARMRGRWGRALALAVAVGSLIACKPLARQASLSGGDEDNRAAFWQAR